MNWHNNFLNIVLFFINCCGKIEKRTIIQKTMKQNVNEGESITKKRGPVWKVKVGVFSPVFIGSRIRKIESKFWKFKEILN